MRGAVQGAPEDWGVDSSALQTLEEVSTSGLGERLRQPDMTILDVREPVEWETGHLPGATLIRLADLRSRLHELRRDAPVLVICEAGVRSSSAASILQQAGFPRVSNVLDGTAGCRKAGLALQYPTTE